MEIIIAPNKLELGRRAAREGAVLIRAAIERSGDCTIVVATGASQFEMLDALTQAPDIDWSKVTGFHLDEYVGMPITHAASFRKYLKERFVERLPVPLAAFHYIDAEGDYEAERMRLNAALEGRRVDVAFIGIGENGHLAFNDPPADFQTEEPYIVVALDEACRLQQVGEGWFPDLAAVPTQAISMSIRQIMKAVAIQCSVPDLRKAAAVRNSVTGPVDPTHPASILQQHPNTRLYLDRESASLIEKSM